MVDSGELHGGLNLATMIRALKSRRRLAGGEGFLFIREKISEFRLRSSDSLIPIADHVFSKDPSKREKERKAL